MDNHVCTECKQEVKNVLTCSVCGSEICFECSHLEDDFSITCSACHDAL